MVKDRWQEYMTTTEPLGITNLESEGQFLLAEFVVGLRIALAAACRLAPILKASRGQREKRERTISVWPLLYIVRHAPFVLRELLAVDNYIWGGAEHRIVRVSERARTVLRDLLEPGAPELPTDEPVTVQKRA